MDELRGEFYKLSARFCPEETPLNPNLEVAGLRLEGTVAAGGTTASSFGERFSTYNSFGRFVVSMPVGFQTRLQFDVDGQRTGDYGGAAGRSSYGVGTGHANWNYTRSYDFGVFGGLQRATPTFSEPSSTNNFFGIEGRAFFNSFMVGGQLGRIDVSSGPGTLTDALFGEARFKLDMGRIYGAATPFILGGGVGHASGKLQNTPLDATSTYWNSRLAFPSVTARITAYLDYTGFDNRVQHLGTVWREDIWMIGIQFNSGIADSPQKAIEPQQQRPLGLGMTNKF